jgi:hypothetical protein
MLESQSESDSKALQKINEAFEDVNGQLTEIVFEEMDLDKTQNEEDKF